MGPLSLPQNVIAFSFLSGEPHPSVEGQLARGGHIDESSSWPTKSAFPPSYEGTPTQ